jgi:hypothetical protein
MSKPLISILCPTRRRPGQVKDLIASAAGTATYPEQLQFVFYVDGDDPTRNEIQSLQPQAFGVPVEVITGPRVVLSQMWNECYKLADADVLMQCGDDIRFRTRGWDTKVLSQFLRYPDRIALVHGQDGIQGDRIATHGFLHRRWVNVVGYFVPPIFASDYNDLWLTEVADAIQRRIYLPEVYTEHMHPVAGKGPLDRTHQERLDRHNTQDCDRLWRDTAIERRVDADKLRAYIEGFAAARSLVGPGVASLVSETGGDPDEAVGELVVEDPDLVIPSQAGPSRPMKVRRKRLTS